MRLDENTVTDHKSVQQHIDSLQRLLRIVDCEPLGKLGTSHCDLLAGRCYFCWFAKQHGISEWPHSRVLWYEKFLRSEDWYRIWLTVLEGIESGFRPCEWSVCMDYKLGQVEITPASLARTLKKLGK